MIFPHLASARLESVDLDGDVVVLAVSSTKRRQPARVAAPCTRVLMAGIGARLLIFLSAGAAFGLTLVSAGSVAERRTARWW
jgi:hypothetical protein